MSEINFYFDEDSMDHRLVAALRSRGVRVLTVIDAGMSAKTDQEQLVFATAQQCAVYTSNICDYQRLHTEWLTAGRTHAGIILFHQRYSVGEQLTRIMRLRASRSSDSLRNQVEFLSNWD